MSIERIRRRARNYGPRRAPGQHPSGPGSCGTTLKTLSGWSIWPGSSTGWRRSTTSSDVSVSCKFFIIHLCHFFQTLFNTRLNQGSNSVLLKKWQANSFFSSDQLLVGPLQEVHAQALRGERLARRRQRWRLQGIPIGLPSPQVSTLSKERICQFTGIQLEPFFLSWVILWELKMSYIFREVTSFNNSNFS